MFLLLNVVKGSFLHMLHTCFFFSEYVFLAFGKSKAAEIIKNLIHSKVPPTFRNITECLRRENEEEGKKLEEGSCKMQESSVLELTRLLLIRILLHVALEEEEGMGKKKKEETGRRGQERKRRTEAGRRILQDAGKSGTGMDTS